MKKKLLYTKDIVRLYKKARQVGKSVLLHIVWKEQGHNEEDVIAILVNEKFYGRKCRNMTADYLAGPYLGNSFLHSSTWTDAHGWAVTQATEEDLLLYLDRPINSKLITDVLNGNIKILPHEDKIVGSK
jgi:hypothetical protein